MEVNFIFKIAAIGIIIAVLNTLLVRSGREDQAMLTTLAGVVVVLMMINSSMLLVISTAIDEVGKIIDKTKVQAVVEIGVEKYVNYQIDEDTKEKLINYYKYRPLNNDILNIMKSLKDNNYKIYILSDNNIDTYNYLKEKKELSFEMHPLG